MSTATTLGVKPIASTDCTMRFTTKLFFALFVLQTLLWSVAAINKCPQIRKPVCCEQNGTVAVATVNNSCYCDGTVLYEGACVVHPTPSASPSASLEPVEIEEDLIEPTIGPESVEFPDMIACTAAFSPVCCEEDGGIRSTKSNECWCKSSLGEVVYQGLCLSEPEPGRDKPCDDPKLQVCCRSPITGAVYTAQHKCACTASNHVILYFGECTF